MYRITYKCPDCGSYWQDEYECACDGECPSCGDKAVTPAGFIELNPTEPPTPSLAATDLLTLRIAMTFMQERYDDVLDTYFHHVNEEDKPPSIMIDCKLHEMPSQEQVAATLRKFS